MDQYREIPYIRLSGVQKAKAIEILLRGNALLKKWAEFYPPKKYRQFRNRVLSNPVVLLKTEDNPKGVIPEDRAEEFFRELPDMLAIHKNPQKELDNRTVLDAVLSNFVAAAKQYAHRWSQAGDSCGITRQDYLQEAFMTVQEAMYQYTRPDIELSTFVFTALKNRMINVTNSGNMLCPWTNADLELMSRYEEAKRRFNGSVTFDQIVDVLGLSSDQGRQLSVLLTRVFAENQLGGTRDDGMTRTDSDQCGNDYTGHRIGIDHESETNISDQEQYVKEVLDSAGLSVIERELVEMAMNNYYGWQSEFAKAHLNPVTKKPYSRMRITQLLKRAQAKVAKRMRVLEEVAA